MQHKTIKRALAMALVLMLVVGLCPLQTAAAEPDRGEEIKQQIRDVFAQCKRQSGYYSFFGYCGTMVGWQLYVMGITSDLVTLNGNQHFDYHRYQEYTSGGYRVRAYSAQEYSLEESLNLISHNGTKDVYNILVGFEQTNTAAGLRFGHALVVYAIVDGVVYFNESYTSYLNGKYYREGEPMSCTIAEFCKYYSRWNRVDGVIYFGLKTYAESCTYYPAYLYAGATESTQLYTAPCEPEVDDRCQYVRDVLPGERISVTGLYLNPQGEYWYQVEEHDQIAYIRADFTRVLSMRYDDVTVDSVAAPTELRQGRGFDVKGKLRSTYNEICTVRAQVFQYEEEGSNHIMSTTHSLEGQSYSLSRTVLSNQLAFRTLKEGSYRYELAVVVGNHYFADGCLQTEWTTLKLYRSDFRVVTRQGNTYSITFNADGGEAELNAAEVAQGDSLEKMPTATREGYVFNGWYTPDGQLVTEDTILSSSMELTARWISAEDVTGWYLVDGGWVYLENGQQVTGFIRTDGITYHVNENGTVDVGWVTINNRLFYFNGNGAMQTGWMDGDDGRYYLTATGAAVGWMYIEDDRYYFNDKGIMLTGKQLIGGQYYIFDENGVLQS